MTNIYPINLFIVDLKVSKVNIFFQKMEPELHFQNWDPPWPSSSPPPARMVNHYMKF